VEMVSKRWLAVRFAWMGAVEAGRLEWLDGRYGRCSGFGVVGIEWILSDRVMHRTTVHERRTHTHTHTSTSTHTHTRTWMI
jgi:hypothetical protein